MVTSKNIMKGKYTREKITYIVAQPMMMTGFRPYLSAMTPHRTDVSALPIIYEDPSSISFKYNECHVEETAFEGCE